MNDDSRCCGSGTCIINAEGLCWCGQQWDKLASNKQDSTENPLDSALQESGTTDSANT